MSREKMNAMVLREFNTPLVNKKITIPEINFGEVLVKVFNCGVCGTDLKIYRGLLPPSIITLPHVMGHEIAGEVVDVAADVQDVKIGDKVIVYFYIGCGQCKFCLSGRENICKNIKRCGFELDGGYAQFVKVPAKNLCLFNDLSYPEAAVLPDAVATSYHAIKTMGQVRVGDRVLIMGAGGLGIHAVQIAKLCGADVAVVNRTASKLDRVKELIDDVHLICSQNVNVHEYIMDWTKGNGVDVVIDTIGYIELARQWGFSSLSRGGRYIIVGYDLQKPLPINMMEMHYNEWQLIGSRVSTKLELEEVIQLVERKKIIPVIDKIYPIQKVNEALNEIAEGKIVGRVVLDHLI
jgi:propanol-preferring alcohol dehydrogenase